MALLQLQPPCMAHKLYPTRNYSTRHNAFWPNLSSSPSKCRVNGGKISYSPSALRRLDYKYPSKILIYKQVDSDKKCNHHLPKKGKLIRILFSKTKINTIEVFTKKHLNIDVFILLALSTIFCEDYWPNVTVSTPVTSKSTSYIKLRIFINYKRSLFVCARLNKDFRSSELPEAKAISTSDKT